MADLQTSWMSVSGQFRLRVEGLKMWGSSLHPSITCLLGPLAAEVWFGGAASPCSPSQHWPWSWGLGNDSMNCDSVQRAGCPVAEGQDSGAEGDSTFFSTLP